MSKAMSSARGAWTSTRGRRHMTETKNEKELAKPSTVEPFHTAARLRELAAEATTPWVKQYLRSLIAERATDRGRARGLETKLTLSGARV